MSRIIELDKQLIVITMETVKTPTAWMPADSNSGLCLRQILKPSLITLSVSGCYTYDGEFIKTGRETDQGRRYRVFGTIYRIFILVVLLAACPRAICAYFYLPHSALQFNSILFIWYVHSLLNFFISIKTWHSKLGGQRQAYDTWDDKIRPMLEELGIEIPEQTVRRRQVIYLIMLVGFIISNTIGIALFVCDVFSVEYRQRFTSPLQASPGTLFATILMCAIISTTWLMPYYYIIVMCTLLARAFQAFNKYIEKQVSKKLLSTTPSFHKLRVLHLNMCNMVSELDKDYGYYFATAFVFDIAIACFTLYQLLKTQPPTIEVVMYLLWMVASLTVLGVLSIFNAFVNEAVSTTYHISQNKHTVCLSVLKS